MKFLKLFISAWKKHWKIQIPSGFALIFCFMLLFKQITIEQWAVGITAFSTLFKMILDASKSNTP